MDVLMSALFTSKQTADALVKRIDSTVRKCITKVDKRVANCFGKVFACVQENMDAADAFSQTAIDTIQRYCGSAVSSADELAAPLDAKLSAAGYAIDPASGQYVYSPSVAGSGPTYIGPGKDPALSQPVPPPAPTQTATGTPIIPFTQPCAAPSFYAPDAALLSAAGPPVVMNGKPGTVFPPGYYLLTKPFVAGVECVTAICWPKPGQTAADIQAQSPGFNVFGPFDGSQLDVEDTPPYSLPVLCGPSGPPIVPPVISTCPPCTPCTPCPPIIPCPPCPTPPPASYNLWRRCKSKAGSPDCYCLPNCDPANDPGDAWLGQFATIKDCEAAGKAACNPCGPSKSADVCEGADFKWMLCDESQPDIDDFYDALGFPLPPLQPGMTPTAEVANDINTMLASTTSSPSSLADPYDSQLANSQV